MEKIVLYARVSTKEQGRKESIQTQLSKLKEKYPNTTQVYKDIASGAYIQRDGLNQLREDAKKGLFDIVAVYSLDRLSRNLGHQIALLEEFEKAGIKVEVLGENYEDTPEGMLNRNIRGAFSEYERYKIAKRMTDGKYRKAKDEFMGGTPPYGYKVIKNSLGKKCLEIEPTEAKVVKQMFKVYLEEQGLGRTATRIYEMGFRSKTERNGEHISFSQFVIGFILNNETYIGNSYFGKTYPCEPDNPVKKERKSRLSSRKYRPKSEWIKLTVPAIIDKTTFERVQKIREEKAKQSLKPTRNYLLQGLIKCPHCGYKYIGKMKSKSHRPANGHNFSYLCPGKSGRRRPEGHRCHSREISTNYLDERVWDKFSSLIKQPKKLKESIKLSEEKRKKEKGFNQKVYDTLIVEKAEIKKKKSQLLDYFTGGNLLKEDLDSKLSDLNNQEQDFQGQIKEIETELAKIETNSEAEKEIENLCLEYQDEMGTADFGFEDKKRMLRRWVREIMLPDGGGIAIKFRIPSVEEPIKLQSVPNSVGASSGYLSQKKYDAENGRVAS